MNVRSIVSAKKIAIFALFVASILATLLIFEKPRAIAQNDLNSFLAGVSNYVASNCRQYGSQCGNCAYDVAQNIINNERISNPRIAQLIHNAAQSGCR